MGKISTLILTLLFISAISCFSSYSPDPDYKAVLKLSLLFYEAQRSGRLPQNNRIKWRGDSALNDRGLNGEDLTGGYYDASDFVKFGFTMAFTTTILAWGLLSYEDSYKAADQYKEALDAIKWASDYFIKCHVSPFEFYGQVGDFFIDHRYWGRPEELNTTRPAYKIDINHPGSDLAGETAAALAVTSLVFKSVNETYSQLSLNHSIELYEFAVSYRGLYHETIPGAKTYYQSLNYVDELAWAAVWLYKATKDEKYLNDAEKFYSAYKVEDDNSIFSFNTKAPGVEVLLAEETNKGNYLKAVESFCDYSINNQKRTPRGLVFFDKMGTLSLASNVAFLCLQAANLNISQPTYVSFAKQQINYMLGSNGRSYVVGYGNNYPQNPHHCASSCPDLPKPCGWDDYKSKGPNPQVLYGALVSGPDQNDFYEDIRDEFLYNEVTLDYNAGFQSAIAGLIQYVNLV